MSSTPRLPPDERGSTDIFCHTPSLEFGFWSLWKQIWTDEDTKDSAELIELIRFRGAIHADCFT